MVFKPHSPPLLTKEERGGRFLFDEALALLDDIKPVCKPRHIFEIGVVRDIRPIARPADGHSSLVWAKAPGTTVTFVDTSPRAMRATQQLCGGARPKGDGLQFIIADALEYLQDMEHPLPSIHLLYLDGPDPTPEGQQHCADCVSDAWLAGQSIILIDDCDFGDRGKGALAIDKAIGLGFDVVLDNVRQVLLARDIPTVDTTPPMLPPMGAPYPGV